MSAETKLTPNIAYDKQEMHRAYCRTCGWSGTWGSLRNAVINQGLYHRCRRILSDEKEPNR